ncbi:hypothetical protein [Nonomuraea sp. NPDC049480]|uniref:hypothetical protein n=1 Tax=Nonomuraea sp. NPDC049480 TaxID=3364353 RepID=UPI0037A0EC3D
MPGFKTFSTNEVMDAAEMTQYFVQQNAIVKPSDESVTSTTVLQPDNDFSVSVSANTDYYLEMFLIYSADPAGDLKVDWDGPSGATLDWVSDGFGSSPADTVDPVSRTVQSIGSTPSHGGITNNSTILCGLHKGILRVAATSGTFVLTWAQLASSANATFVRANSMMLLTRIS